MQKRRKSDGEAWARDTCGKTNIWCYGGRGREERKQLWDNPRVNNRRRTARIVFGLEKAQDLPFSKHHHGALFVASLAIQAQGCPNPQARRNQKPLLPRLVSPQTQDKRFRRRNSGSCGAASKGSTSSAAATGPSAGDERICVATASSAADRGGESVAAEESGDEAEEIVSYGKLVQSSEGKSWRVC